MALVLCVIFSGMLNRTLGVADEMLALMVQPLCAFLRCYT